MEYYTSMYNYLDMGHNTLACVLALGTPVKLKTKLIKSELVELFPRYVVKDVLWYYLKTLCPQIGHISDD